jgi:hypothetical protein
MNNFKTYFGESLGVLAIALDFDLTDAKVDVYFKLLAGKYPDEEIIRAIEHAASACKFFPKPAELVEIITGGKVEKETVAWRTVIENIKRHGSYYSVRFQDGSIAAAIEGMGGWPEMCAKSGKEFTLERVPAQFVALYNNAVSMGISEHSATVLGSVETENAARGLAVEDERYVRDAVTMAEVMAAPVQREAISAEARKAIEYHAQDEPQTHEERGQRAETNRLLKQLGDRMKMGKELGISTDDVIRLEEVAHVCGITVKEALAREREALGGPPANDPAKEIPTPILTQMQEAEELQKDLRRIGGGRAYYEPKREPGKAPDCWEGLL